MADPRVHRELLWKLLCVLWEDESTDYLETLRRGGLDGEEEVEYRKISLEAYREMVDGDACCTAEDRDMNGGCTNCGAPCI